MAEQGIESGAARHRAGANLSGVRKAAILLVAVGEELAKEVLRCLPENDVQQITEELADLRGITPELSAEVLEEFWGLLDTQNFMVHGGLDYASRVLIEAFGKQRADDMMALMRRSQEAAQGNLAKLQRTDPQQLGKLLDSEHPQTIALVLAHLDPKRASMVLDNLSEEHKVVSIQRLAEMRQFSPEMAQKVALILHRRLESVGDTARRSYSGFKAVADLLNRLNAEESKKILETIEENQPELALSIRNLMFTFEDLITVPAATIREIVSGVDKRQLALALRGANDELARADLQGHELARRGDAEGGHGGARPGALARGGAGAAGDSEPCAAARGRRQGDPQARNRRRDAGVTWEGAPRAGKQGDSRQWRDDGGEA